MNTYERCKEHEKAHKELDRQMVDAYEAWKQILDEMLEYQQQYGENIQKEPGLLYDRALVERLQKKADEKYAEFTSIGEKRLDAFWAWATCLQQNV